VQTTYLSGGKPVTIEVFVPPTPGQYPIVLALHGSSGIYSGSMQFPQMLADRGFAVFLPHFFETTGTTRASPLTIRDNFPTWTIAISDALDFAQDYSQSDRRQIGIVGFSLGAYLALALASQQSRVKAVVDFFGGMPDHFAEQVRHLPPVLILHGDQDTVVPVTEAHKIEALYRARQAAYEIKIYPNANHGFNGFNMLDAGQRTYFFLKKYLAGGSGGQ
jgi:carboxymethylenebutenolidase